MSPLEDYLDIKKIAEAGTLNPTPLRFRSPLWGSLSDQPAAMRASWGFLAMGFDVCDDILDGFNFFSVLIRDFHLILFFERHHQLDNI
jgi:hypothetical protein